MEVTQKHSSRIHSFKDHPNQAKRKKEFLHKSPGVKNRKSGEYRDRSMQPSRMVFVPDPLNLTAICNPASLNVTPPQTDKDLDSLHYEPTNDIAAFHSRDPLNLNALENSSNKDPNKQVRKRKKRKRRNTSGDIEDEKIYTADKNASFSDSDLISPNVDAKEFSEINSQLVVDEANKKIISTVVKDIPPKVDNHNKNHGPKNKSNSKKRTKDISDIKFSKNNEKFKYGNIDIYFSVNHNQLIQILNNRFCLFKKEWFHDSLCLDIGCNAGYSTSWIAKYFEPKHILGVDIDTKLIQKTSKTLQQFTHHPRANRFPKSFAQLYGGLGRGSRISNTNSCIFPNNLSFTNENYVPASSTILKHTKALYDVILCLNICKWVHLNFGDGAIKLMFKKIYLQLRPGGRLLLELQHYSSYKKHKNYTPEMHDNFSNVKLMPSDFISYLLSSEIGFSRSECLGYTKRKTGRDRPVYMLLKSHHQDESTAKATTIDNEE